MALILCRGKPSEGMGAPGSDPGTDNLDTVWSRHLGARRRGSGKSRETSYEVTAHLVGGEGRGLWRESSGLARRSQVSGSMLKAELSRSVSRPHMECERKVRVKQEET